MLWAHLHVQHEQNSYCSGCLGLWIYFGALHHSEWVCYSVQRAETQLCSDCSDTSELQGADLLLYLQLWIRLDFLCWKMGLCRVSFFHLCVCVCVCLRRFQNVEKLGHDVCTGACSNNGQLCSLDALSYCTLHLRQPASEQTQSCFILCCHLLMSGSSWDMDSIYNVDS